MHEVASPKPLPADGASACQCAQQMPNTKLAASRSRLGMVDPDRIGDDHPGRELPLGRTETFQRDAGGIKSGYRGHVPSAFHRFASSHFGAFADDGMHAQRPPPTMSEKAVERSSKAPTQRQAASIPGYRGHRRGQEEYMGTSFWYGSSPIADQRRQYRQPPRYQPRQWRITPHPNNDTAALSARQQHPVPPRAASQPATVSPASPPPTPSPLPEHAREAPRGSPPKPVAQLRLPTAVASASGTTAGPIASARARLQTRAHPRPTAWTLTSEDFGKAAEEPGRPPEEMPDPPSSAQSGWARLRKTVSVPNMRDPDVVALKPKMVRRIVSGLSGPADTWVPPAGLYLENSKEGMGQNLWDATTETRHLGPKPTAPRGAWIQLPKTRDPDALKPKHVAQVTKNLRGPAATYKPPAGLYIENSRHGLGYNMWEVVRQQKSEAGLLANAEAPHAACGDAALVA